MTQIAKTDVKTIKIPINMTFIKEMECVIKVLTHTHTHTHNPYITVLGDEFCETFKKKITFILRESFKKIKEEGILPNAFYEARIIQLPKYEKGIKGTKNKKPISFISPHTQNFFFFLR